MQSNNTHYPARYVTRWRIILLLGILGFQPMPLQAGPPELSLPLDCKVGETCWLVNLVDRQPGPGRTDFRCGALSYDTHKGTDFAIANDAEMRKGVSVLAAAPGRVLRVRDGEPDSTPQDLQSATALRGRECGNGLVIDHGDGWSTQYCHLKAGTLRVVSGQQVDRATPLGEVGRSGRSEFPHVHLAVRQGDTVIDPFSGDTSIGLCNPQAETDGLWAENLRDVLQYPGPQPFHLGFAAGIPAKADIEAGRLSSVRFGNNAPALVFWAEAFTLSKGDKITLTLTGPGSELIADHHLEIDRPLAKWHGFTGRKRRGTAWESGEYQGRMLIERGGARVEKSATSTVE
ncbi:MAG: M23 family metallopeptidase [Rhodospirillales bacterium]